MAGYCAAGIWARNSLRLIGNRTGSGSARASDRSPFPSNMQEMQRTAPTTPSGDSSLTDYVAGFVVATRANDLPADVRHLGTRSFIDGLGLALAGAASQTGAITRRCLVAK